MLVWGFDGQLIAKPGPSLLDLNRPLINLYFAERFNYWALDCENELCLRLHTLEVVADWHNLELFAMLLSHRLSHDKDMQGRWRVLEL